MSIESEFQNAIAVNPNPDDDSHRLIYADWLEDNDDPDRAELIRSQCRPERRTIVVPALPPDDTAGLSETETREWALMDALLTPVPGQGPRLRELTPEIAAIVANDRRRITFNRGMIHDLNLGDSAITTLPSDLHVGGDLNLLGTAILALPPGLHVGGDLNLADTAITVLPPDLHVGGDLTIAGTRITALPPDLHVGGDLDLYDTAILTLPPGLHVGGDLYLHETAVWELPLGLHVDGDLDLRNTHIMALPSDLHVGGDLYFYGTAITDLPSGLHVGGDLDLSNTAVAALPPDLHVGGNLYLAGTHIDAAAARQILDMPNLSAQARVTGLESAGFPTLAAEASRQTEANGGPTIPPKK